jgi:hypothetical protein
MISKFSARIAQLVSANEASLPGDAGFASAIARARSVLNGVEPQFSFTFHLDASPKAMGSDPSLVFRALLRDTEGWLGFIVHSVAFRLGHFLDDLVSGLNSGRSYRTVGAARCLLEIAAFAHHDTKLVMEAYKNVLGAAPNDFNTTILGIVELLKVASQFAMVTRFNWRAMAKGDTEEFYTNGARLTQT